MSLLILEDRIPTLARRFVLSATVLTLATAYACGGGGGNGVTNGDATSTPENPTGFPCPAYTGKGKDHACDKLESLAGAPQNSATEILICGGVVGSESNPYAGGGEENEYTLLPGARIDVQYLSPDGTIIKTDTTYADHKGYYAFWVDPSAHFRLTAVGNLNGAEVIVTREYRDLPRPAGEHFCLPIEPTPTALNENPLLNASYVLVAKPQVRPDYMKLLKG